MYAEEALLNEYSIEQRFQTNWKKNMERDFIS